MKKLMCALFSCIAISSSFAASSSMTTPNGNACMFKVDIGQGTRYINVLYVRDMVVTEPSNLFIQLAYTTNTKTKDYIDIHYANLEIARRSADIIADRITFCKEQAYRRGERGYNAVKKEEPVRFQNIK